MKIIVNFRYKLLEAEGIASTLKRTVEVISKDNVKDSAEPEMKKMRLEKDQVCVALTTQCSLPHTEHVRNY